MAAKTRALLFLAGGLGALVACRGVLGIEDLPGQIGDGGASVDGQTSDAADDGASGQNDGGSTSDGSNVDGAFEDVLLGGDADRRWAQWPVPPVSPPVSQYQMTTDTVFDTVTGLMWQRQPASPATMTWDTALTYCENLTLATHSDWRLPTRIELLSTLDYGQALHLTNDQVFTNRPAPPAETNFWTRSEEVPASGKRWYVSSFDGSVGSISSISSAWYNVRCVRLGKTGSDSPRYVVQNGTAYDPRTKLTWEVGMRNGTTTLPNAQSYCQTLSLGAFASGWRLPTIRELHTLYDETATQEPFWDSNVFTISGGAYVLWSGTLRTNPANKNYVVDFFYANTYANDPSLPTGTRCVHP